MYPPQLDPQVVGRRKAVLWPMIGNVFAQTLRVENGVICILNGICSLLKRQRLPERRLQTKMLRLVGFNTVKNDF